MQEILKEPEMI